MNFLQKVNAPNVVDLVRRKASDIFSPILFEASDIDEFASTIGLAVSKFSFSPDAGSDLLDNLSEVASSLLNERIEADIEDLKEYTNAQDFVNEKEEQAESIKRDLETYGLTLNANFGEYNAYDWWEIGTQNYFADQMAKDD